MLKALEVIATKHYIQKGSMTLHPRKSELFDRLIHEFLVDLSEGKSKDPAHLARLILFHFWEEE